MLMILSWTRNDKDIFGRAIQLHTEDVYLKHENNTVRFLGVHIKQDPKSGFLNTKGRPKQRVEDLRKKWIEF